MPTFSLFGKAVELLASPAPTACTRDETAWLHRRYLSVCAAVDDFERRRICRTVRKSKQDSKPR